MKVYYWIIIVLVYGLTGYKIIRSVFWGKAIVNKDNFKTEAFFYVWGVMCILFIFIVFFSMNRKIYRPYQLENQIFWVGLSLLNMASFSRPKITKNGIMYKIACIKWNQIEKVNFEENTLSFFIKRDNKKSGELKIELSKKANLMEIKEALSGYV